MASLSSMLLSVLLSFLVLFSFSAKTITARENFSKFTHVVENNSNAHKQTTILPDKVNDKVVVHKQQQQKDPTFLPETTDNGYGLYGHETTENIPINNNKKKAEKYYYTDKEYEESLEQEDMVDPNLLENGYTTPTTNNNYYDNRDNKFNNQQLQEEKNDVPRNMPYNTRQQQDNNVYDRRYNQRSYNTENSRQYNEEVQQRNYDRRQYNMERQGMSDTRYMENGRYFYDINDDKKYYRNSNKGYYGNNNMYP